MSEKASAFIESNRERFLEELLAFLRIPSISTLPEHREDVRNAAAFVAGGLRAAGMENVEITETEGHPLVYADWMHAPGKPTVLCYGHYDVQPPDPLDLWKSPPFEPVIRDGNLYARGSADDKGQMYIQVKAVEALIETAGSLPVNVKFLVEGEEEIGGKSVAKFVAANGEKLKADVALVSDTAMYAPGLPTLCVGLRGLVYTEVTVKGAARDLHSGLYGGAAPNPVFALIELLGQAKDAGGRILIPGFYDDVENASAVELESWDTLPFNEAEFLRKEIGAQALTGESEYTVLERIWSRPTLEVHGIAGGFTGAGAKTVIPAEATAKVSFRLVPNQDPDKIVASFRKFVAERTPAGVLAEVKLLSGGPACVVDPEHPAIRVAASAFEETFARETVFVRSGGSIPIVGDFATHLGIPTILMGFGLPDDGLHSPNEKFAVENFYKGIHTVAHFLEKYGESS